MCGTVLKICFQTSYIPVIRGQRTKVNVGTSHANFTGLKTEMKTNKSQFSEHIQYTVKNLIISQCYYYYYRHHFTFPLISAYPSAFSQDCCFGWVVEAELMHSSQSDHHPCRQKDHLPLVLLFLQCYIDVS